MTSRDEGRSELLEVRVEKEESTTRVSPVGEIDMATAPKLEAALREVATAGARRLIVDLASVTFIDSSGIYVLCKAVKAASQDGFEFGVSHSTDRIRRLFVLAGIDQIVPVIEA